ncbi:coth protein-domain-containing protein [Mucor mucedo]|uniref:coth protein-domain-containing protein n=1 Tax=Mucor mucedo TaxID=29922 RepID=UPI00221F876F|nr:coth protein-domain-containing protein [Mucor mucedo]KAI7894227.1 coth protein-domain-containing protein [Mucor mucedo]
MKILTVLPFLILGLVTSAYSSGIQYSVISLISKNQNLGVIVDDQMYPLSNNNEATPLLHRGQAPISSTGYRYAILSRHQVLDVENFTRHCSSDNIQKNDYYGRSWNSYHNLTKLPTLLPPLDIMDRIQSSLHIDNEIPTIHLYGNKTEIDNMHHQQTDRAMRVELNMAYISPKDVKVFKNITLSISGMFTRNMNKLSYKVKLAKNQDLYGYRRIKLKAMALDMSYMRENLGYAITESIGLPSSGHSYVRVYINDQAIGLFGLTEHIKGDWVKKVFGHGSKNYKHGALFIANIQAYKGNTTQTKPSQSFVDINEVRYKNSTSSLSYLGSELSAYSAGQYSVKVKPSDGDKADFTCIMDLIKFIQSQPNKPANNSVVPLWNDKMDVDSLLRGLAFEIVVSSFDGYLGMANNFILFQDIQHNRMVFSEQDFDSIMGSGTYNISLMVDQDYTQFPGFQTRVLIPRLMQVPRFKQQFEMYVNKFVKELVNPQILGRRIDQLFQMLSEDVAWDKSLPRMGQSLGPVGALMEKKYNVSSISEVTFSLGVYGPMTDNILMALYDWLSLRSSNLLNKT